MSRYARVFALTIRLKCNLVCCYAAARSIVTVDNGSLSFADLHYIHKSNKIMEQMLPSLPAAAVVKIDSQHPAAGLPSGVAFMDLVRRRLLAFGPPDLCLKPGSCGGPVSSSTQAQLVLFSSTQ